MLEHELRELQVEWPDTPDIAGAVAPRLTAPPPRRRWVLSRPAWQVAIAAVALVIAVVMVIPPARAAVLEFLGLRGVQIERREPRPSRFGQEAVVLGDPVSLETARRRAGFPVGVPAELGAPDAVFFYDGSVAGPRVDMTYRPRPGLERSGTTGVGLLVTELRATAMPVIQKAVGTGARVEQLTIDGDPAVFISGRPHGFAYTPPNGQTQFEDQRLAGNTLVIDRRDGVLLRLEGELTRDEAVRIGRSVR